MIHESEDIDRKWDDQTKVCQLSEPSPVKEEMVHMGRGANELRQNFEKTSPMKNAWVGSINPHSQKFDNFTNVLETSSKEKVPSVTHI